ncbi:MAG: hypothetical protein GY757_47540 [bacterium]|nr:hypothetical protein [bacterium]
MKGLKKLDARMLQYLVMVVIAAIFVYTFYSFYTAQAEYREDKKAMAVKAAKKSETPTEIQLPVTPPPYSAFAPDKGLPAEKCSLFTFKKKKKEETGKNKTGQQQTQKPAPVTYAILGVVKRDKLFLAVRLNQGNKIKLYHEGASIDNNNRIKKLEPGSAIIADSSGQERVHKIFQLHNIKEIGETSIKKSPAQQKKSPVKKKKQDKGKKEDKNRNLKHEKYIPKPVQKKRAETQKSKEEQKQIEIKKRARQKQRLLEEKIRKSKEELKRKEAAGKGKKKR